MRPSPDAYTVGAEKTSVDVVRGRVEVADFKSGQIAQLMAGQQATTFTAGKVGLSLHGSGTFAPIEQGKPRAPSIAPVQVPRGGLTAPRNANGENGIKASRLESRGLAKLGAVRISSPIGEVRLNVHRVINGLARDSSATNSGSRNSGRNSVWQSDVTANQGGNIQGEAGGGNGVTNAAGLPTYPGAATNGGNGIANGLNGNSVANGNVVANGSALDGNGSGPGEQ